LRTYIKHLLVLLNGAILFFACNNPFSEFPPLKYLTEKQELEFLRLIIRDTLVSNNLKMDIDLVSLFSLNYLIQKNDKYYFLLSENGKSSFIKPEYGDYYGGYVTINNSDTTHTILFSREVQTEPSINLLKETFNLMIENKKVNRFIEY
jgi:hypothetical protein